MTASPYVERLSPEQCLDHLGETSVGRVALSLDGLPAIRAVRFALTPAGIVFRAAPDSRLRAGTSSKVIAFHTDKEDESRGFWWAVNVVAICREVTATEEIEELRALALPAWHGSTSSDTFMRLPVDEIVSGERVYWG